MNRILASLPIIGIALFILLYFYSASLYPGGTTFDPTTRGFSHLKNYWTDLVDLVAHNGERNLAYPYAVVATILLPLSLMPFWWFVPEFFNAKRWKRSTVRLSGSLAMVFTALLPLDHDAMINVASLFGFSAFTITLTSLIQNRQFKLAIFGSLAIVFCLTNYLMWQMDFCRELLPLAQRMAYLSLFIWIVMTSVEYIRKSASILVLK